MFALPALRHVLPMVLAGLLPAAAAASVSTVERVQITGASRDLAEGLDAARLDAVPSSGRFDTVIIRFSDATAVEGLEPAVAERVQAITLHLSSIMQSRYGERYRFISAEAQSALVDDLTRGAASDADRERIASGIAARSRPDIVIRPVLLDTDQGRAIVFQALSAATGETLATSRLVPLTDIRPETGELTASIPPTSDGVFRPVALEAERLLAGHGYDPGLIDGYIDDSLRAALRRYQSDSALAPSGRLTWETVENLRRDRRTAR